MITAYLEAFSNYIQIPYDQVWLIAVMGLGIPIALCHYLIKNPTCRLYYSLVFGLLLQYMIYGFTGIIHTMVAGLFTYYFIQYFGRKQSGFWIFGITLVHLTLLQIEKRYNLNNKWAISSPATVYMMTIPKYCSLAFSYEDGEKDDKDLKSEHMRQYKIVEKPTLLEVLSFIYFYPTCIIGPSFDFMDYYNFIYGKGCYSRIPFKLTMITGAYYFAYTLGCMVIYAGFVNHFPLNYIGSVEFGERNIFYKLGYVSLGTCVHRFKFYSGFILAYTSLLFSGVSYGEVPRKKDDPAVLKAINGDYEINFEKGSYGKVYDCELGLNPKLKIINWNHSIHLWLKYNLFLRLINVQMKFFKNNYAFAGFMTFMVSAFWHGLYGTYYLFFFALYIFQSGNDVFDKMGLYVFLEKSNSFILKFLMWAFSALTCNSLGAIFFLLQYSLFIQYMKNVYYIPLILAFGTYIVGKVVAFKTTKKTQSKTSLSQSEVDKEKKKQ